tara:strand:+ start:9094 stop:9519 length:426 start_codon:yes stop_codon:yes gene_type:complete
MDVKSIHKGSCHCGSIKFELALPNGLEDLRRCDCSMCSKRGAIVASVPLSGLKITKGEDCLSLYQFNTLTAKHYFCSNCGIYTHHQRRSNPKLFAFNVACLDGIEPYQLGPVPVLDGINHPADKAGYDPDSHVDYAISGHR